MALTRSPLWKAALLTGLALALVTATALSGVGRTSPASAQDPGTPEPPRDVSTVSVTSQGVVTIEPDTASVSIGVEVMRPTLEEAQSEATEQMTAIIDAIEAEGIAEDDIRTTTFSVQVIQEFDRNGNLSEIRGYQVSNQVKVTVRDLDALGTVLDAAVGAGANNIYGINLYVEDTSAAASQARAQAVQDARQKADELAAAAGLQVTRVITITEGFAPPPQPVAFDEAALRSSVAEDVAAVPVQPGTIEVVVEVAITFEIA